MSRPDSWRIEVARIAAIPIAGCLALTSGGTPALGQPVEGSALAYLSIPLDGSTDGPAFGMRLDLRGRSEGGLVDPVPRSDDPPPVLEVRFGSAEEPGELRVGGIAPAMVPDRLGLDGGTALWIWTGLGLAAAVALVIAADAICIGINTTCSKDKDDDDRPANTPQPPPQ